MPQNGIRRKLMVLVVAQAILCAFQTYLISRISLIGKIGIALVHREYRLLRSGGQTFCLLFCIQLLLIALLAALTKKASRRTLVYTASALIILAFGGLILTYSDFQGTYSHRLLKEKFHLGFYLFWMGWIGSCITFLAHKRPLDTTSEPLPKPPASLPAEERQVSDN